MGPSESSRFAVVLRTWRERRLLSQEALADASGLSVRAVRNLELGRVDRPRAASVRLLARALDITGPELDAFEAAARTGPAARRPEPDRSTPAQLPYDTPGFVGRADELAELGRLLFPARAGSATVAGISGTAGVGKSALAVHWGHRFADRFPDGQLYLDLHGYDGEREPLGPAEALARLLRGLGTADADVPFGLDDRAAAYRSAMADRQLLLVLDNAHSAGQVRPLLPASGGCRVLVTSRDSLRGLVAREGMTRLTLDLPSSADALALLRHGLPATIADEASLQTLARLCGRLPLALRVAAERAGAVADTPLAALVAELSEERARLDLLSEGSDAPASVRAVFSWSYRYLSAPAARVFRGIGLLPALDLDARGVAALVAVPEGEARRALAELTESHLVRPVGEGRVRMHDLLRVYAAELSRAEEAPAEREAAVERFLGGYADLTRAAVAAGYPGELVAGTGPADALDPGDAAAWLRREHETLVTVTGLAAERHPALAVDLVDALWPHLYATGAFADAAALLAGQLRAARATGDLVAEASARRNLATVLWTAGRGEEALDELRRSLALLRTLDEPTGTGKTLNNLGILSWWLGHNDEAVAALEEALAVHRRLGNTLDEVKALSNLGLAAWRSGRYRDGLALHEEALILARRLGDQVHEAGVLNNLGVIHQRQGRLEQARACHERALELTRAAGARLDEVESLGDLGLVLAGEGRIREAVDLHEQALALAVEHDDHGARSEAMHNLASALLHLGDHDRARRLQQEALALAERAGDRGRVVISRNGLGEAALQAGDLDAAAAAFPLALAAAERLGDPYEQARALAGLARTSDRAGDDATADGYRRRAVALFRALDVPPPPDPAGAAVDRTETTG